MSKEASRPKRASKLWVIVVLLIGTGLGLVFYSLIVANIEFFPFVPPQIQLEFELYQEIHVILSTVGIALLVALIVVYWRTYEQTRANFVLGLVIVLFALLFQAILTSPVYLEVVEQAPFHPEFSLPLADVFTIVAYAVFLYLSLE